MALIEAIDLEKTYHDEEVETHALRGVSFTIDEGDFVAVMGPSGSGKSTLLHIIGFLDRHTGGTYRFEGKTIDDFTDDEIAHVRNTRMGFVFQSFNLLPRTSVLDNIMLPLTYSDVPSSGWNKRALHAVEAVGLMHRIEHEPSQLSGGEKQRVAIARALVTRPRVIFADEPTGNLDSESGQQIMEILERLNTEDGHTIVLITHETYTAETAERIIHMLDGKIDRIEKVKGRVHAKDGFRK